MENRKIREKPDKEALRRQEEAARRFRALAEKSSSSEGLALLDQLDRPVARD